MTDKIVNKKTGLELEGKITSQYSDVIYFKILGTSQPAGFATCDWDVVEEFVLPTKPGAVVAPVNVSMWYGSSVFTLTDPDAVVYAWSDDLSGELITAQEVMDKIADSGTEYHVVFAGIGADDDSVIV